MMPKPSHEPVFADVQEEENESLEAARTAARSAAERDKRMRKKERQREKKAAEQAKKDAEDEGRRQQEAARRAQASSPHYIHRQGLCSQNWPWDAQPAHCRHVREEEGLSASRQHDSR